MDAARLSSGSTAGAAPSTSGTAPSYSGADGDDGNAGGAKVWVLVLLFALLLLPFLPAAVRRGGTPWGGGGGGGSGRGGYRSGGISFKSGWDVVNLCLVLFAIVCGLLGRGGGGGDGEGDSSPSAGKKERQMSPPAPAMDSVWETYGSFSSAYSSSGLQQHAGMGTGGIRRMKSSSSYPELQLGSDGVWALASPDAAWRFRDDVDLEYRARRPERQERTWDVHLRAPAPDLKTIPVDTFVERRRDETQPRRRRRSVERLPEVEEEPAPTPTVSEQQKSGAPVEVVAPPPQPAPPSPVPPLRRWKRFSHVTRLAK